MAYKPNEQAITDLDSESKRGQRGSTPEWKRWGSPKSCIDFGVTQVALYQLVLQKAGHRRGATCKSKEKLIRKGSGDEAQSAILLSMDDDSGLCELIILETLTVQTCSGECVRT